MLKLYEHNREAYVKVKSYIDRYGKACVIHPTGTGKSYIGFALVEDHPDKKFLWLSPSSYIYKTQTESLKKEQNISFSNVVFRTYSWLIKNIDAIDGINPDYIILDEFHRTGARKWEIGIELLLEAYPEAKILGLTATNIRYLDCRRDMAKEIFDNRIASEMSITEAMARRILPVPKYIISVYSYKEKIDYYEKRVNSTRNKYKKAEGLAILEKLKNRLDDAAGMEKVFAKHIKNRTGKYIIFCSGYDHMCEMMTQVPLWFSHIDRRPRIYSICHAKRHSERDFEQFVNDDSPHLKLLFAIDMVNEGIHVAGVDGVILLRTTTSPIVYKQQIGRALATGRMGRPIIFDMVNNFDSLCNISALKEEYESFYAMKRMLTLDDDNRYEFEIIDELKDCRELFYNLRKNLGSTWEEYYQSLCLYKAKNGTAYVPKRYIDPQGIYLGRWFVKQRSLYRQGNLEKRQIDLLEDLGVSWEEEAHARFEKRFGELLEYKRKYGTVDVPGGYITSDGVALGEWCCRIRVYYRNGKLAKDKIQRFEAIGFEWNPLKQYWDEGYSHAEEYYNRYGNLEVAKKYICDDGYKLGYWVNRQRSIRSGKSRGILGEERVKKLDSIGMIWEYDEKERFMEYVDAYVKYREENGSQIFSNYRSPEGLALGQWVFRMKKEYSEGKMRDYRIKELDNIGFDWYEPIGIWYQQYEKAKEYYEKNGNLTISKAYVKQFGSGLAQWITSQRREYKKADHGKLTDEQIKLLESIGMVLIPKHESDWEKGYKELCNYEKKYGDTLVPIDYVTERGYRLGKWVGHMRYNHRVGKLNKERTEALDKINMCWDNIEIKKAEIHWNRMYEEAKKYYGKHGNLNVPQGYVTENGLKLYTWLMQQRRIKSGKVKHSIKYTDERVAMMNAIGIC